MFQKEIKNNAPFQTYFGVFLTLQCSLRCSYCIQKITLPHIRPKHYTLRSGKEWVAALNAVNPIAQRKKFFFKKRKKLAITGGEPTLHPDFSYIINNLCPQWRITVTTNFNSPFFSNSPQGIKSLKQKRGLRFNGSYHFLEKIPLQKFIENIRKVKQSGIVVDTLFLVGIPNELDKVLSYQQELLKVHPRVKIQRFMGYYQNTFFPLPQEKHLSIEYQHKDGIENYPEYHAGFSQKKKQTIYCKLGKLLFSPNGDLYNCHYKLYTGHPDTLGNLFEENTVLTCPQEYYLCDEFGFCNPCDAEGHNYKRLDGTEFKIT